MNRRISRMMKLHRLFEEVDSNTGDAGGGGGGQDIPNFDMDKAAATLAADLNLDEGDGSRSAPPSDEADPGKQEEPPSETPEEIEAKAEAARQAAAATAKAPPKSWAADKHEKFASLAPDVQDYILEREAQDTAWMQQNHQRLAFAKELDTVLQPYGAMIQAHGVTAPQAVQRLMDIQYRLSTGDQAQRTAVLQKVAKDFGVDLAKLSPEGEAPYKDPSLTALEEQVQRLAQARETEVSQQRAQIAQRINQEVSAFFADPVNIYANDVAGEIITLINGSDGQMTLAEAYKKAIWANPVTRVREIARQNAEQETKLREQAAAEAEAARKAKGTKVKGKPTVQVAEDFNQSLDDTLRNQLKEINSRAS